MELLGEHAATFFNKGLGWKNRSEAVAEMLGKDLFKAVKLA